MSNGYRESNMSKVGTAQSKQQDWKKKRRPGVQGEEEQQLLWFIPSRDDNSRK